MTIFHDPKKSGNIIEAGITKTIRNQSDEEILRNKEFEKLFRNSPIPEGFLLDNLGLYIKRQNLSRIIMMNDLYKRILDLQGIICEFGVFWGNNLALFESFRGMYEPYNCTRKIVGFDTFEGFPHVAGKDVCPHI